MDELVTLRTASRVAVIIMAVLLGGAIIFYKERILFADACFLIFGMLNHHHFMIQEFRYGSFITQVIPLIAGALHLPLNIIMLAYSISFNLFYFIVIFLLVYKFKQYGLAILMGFYYLLFASDTYFWTNNEVHQGIAWMFLFYGVLFNKKDLERNYSIFSILFLLTLAILAISSHVIVIIPFTFLWLFFWLQSDYRSIYNRAFKWFSIPIILMISIKLVSTQFGYYDVERLGPIVHIKIESVLHVLVSSQAKSFLPLCLTNYWIVMIVFITGLISLTMAKKYWLALLTVLYFMAYFIVMCLIFHDYDRKQLFYMESEWMGLSIIVSAPFVFSFLMRLKNEQVACIVGAIFIVRLIYIGSAVPLFVKREAFIETTCRQIKMKGLSLVVIKDSPSLDEILLMNWGAPVESLFCSAINGDNPQISFVVMDESEIKNRLPISKNEFLSSFDHVKKGLLNPHYFHIDTTQSYKIMSYEELAGN